MHLEHPPFNHQGNIFRKPKPLDFLESMAIVDTRHRLVRCASYGKKCSSRSPTIGRFRSRPSAHSEIDTMQYCKLLNTPQCDMI